MENKNQENQSELKQVIHYLNDNQEFAFNYLYEKIKNLEKQVSEDISKQIKDENEKLKQENLQIQQEVQTLKQENQAKSQKIEELEQNLPKLIEQKLKEFTLKKYNMKPLEGNTQFLHFFDQKNTFTASQDMIRCLKYLPNNKAILSDIKSNKVNLHRLKPLQDIQCNNAQNSAQIYGVIEMNDFIIYQRYDSSGYHYYEVLNSNFSYVAQNYNSGHNDRTYSMCNCHENQYFLSAKNSGYIELWHFNGSNTLTCKVYPQLSGGQLNQYILRLKAQSLYAVGTYGGGLKLIQVVASNNTITLSGTYYSGKYVNSIVEYAQNKLLLASHNNNLYHFFDVSSRSETAQLNLSGLSYPNCLALHPKFNENDFPFIVAKEMGCICLLDIKNQKRTVLFSLTANYNFGGNYMNHMLDFIDDETFVCATAEKEFKTFKLLIQQA